MNKLYIYIYNVEDNYNIWFMYLFLLMDVWFKVEVLIGYDVYERVFFVFL